jgi:hypothetical protein
MYQNYVTSVVSNQNNLNQGADQILQTIANNTSDPDTQAALLNAVGQPNPINDALQQQLQAQADTYQSICQAKMAAAQATAPPDPSQGAYPQQQPDQPSPPDAQDDQPQAEAAPGGDPMSPPMNVEPPPPSGIPQGAPPQATPCASGVTMPLPAPQAPWGQWVPLGSTGLIFGVSRVNPTTLTWRFMNAGSQVVTSMSFNYSFVDANSGQMTTQNDVVPFALKPGKSVGGWTAYTANTRGNINIQITQIACQ